MNYDLIIIGSGPGGYEGAVRAAELGLKTAIIEKSALGGICLNFGCIPTKALLKSASIFNYCKESENFGVEIGESPKANLKKIVARSRNIVETLGKGVDFLMKKHKIDVFYGFAKIVSKNSVEVLLNEDEKIISIGAKNIIIATGACSRNLPNIPQDGKKIIGYKEAMTLENIPETMLVIGSGAIGCEFAYFYQSIGTKVTLVEFLPNILPLEDNEASTALSRSLRKMSMKVMTDSSVEKIDIKNDKCYCEIKTKKGVETIETDIVLSAVGIEANIKNIGLEEIGIEIEKNRIKVDEFYRTNIDGIFGIGDVIATPALAHVATQEAIVCVEKIAGNTVRPINYGIIPSCTYTHPEVASVGLNEQKALEKGVNIKIGKFQFMASGKATASGNKDGFVKIIADADTNIIIGCTLVGENVTEMISEATVLIENTIKIQDILNYIHPHPTMSEGFLEAVKSISL